MMSGMDEATVVAAAEAGAASASHTFVRATGATLDDMTLKIATSCRWAGVPYRTATIGVDLAETGDGSLTALRVRSAGPGEEAPAKADTLLDERGADGLDATCRRRGIVPRRLSTADDVAALAKDVMDVAEGHVAWGGIGRIAGGSDHLFD